MAHALAKLSIALAVPGLFSTAAPAAPYAVSCTGRSVGGDAIAGTFKQDDNPIGEQIFVIDEDKSTVFMARQELEPLCHNARAVVSENKISVNSSMLIENNMRVECKFYIDKKTLSSKFSMKHIFNPDEYSLLLWSMDCKRTVVPVYKTTKTKP